MGCFLVRGGATTTRLGELVDTAVISCLGDVPRVGMIDRDCGSINVGKRGELIKMGGICSSLDPLLKYNH